MNRTLPLLTIVALASGCPTLTNTFTGGGVSALVDDAHGIAAGGQVRVHGVMVARVTEVTLEAEGARIAIDGLPDTVTLKSDACAVVRTHLVANETFLEIQPGHAEAALEGTSLPPCSATSLEQAGTESIAELTGLVRELRAYVARLESGERPLCTVTTAAPTPPAEAPTPTPAPEPAAAAPSEAPEATP
jgi:ABC-type transporter Mla subunit MlaD